MASSADAAAEAGRSIFIVKEEIYKSKSAVITNFLPLVSLIASIILVSKYWAAREDESLAIEDADIHRRRPINKLDVILPWIAGINVTTSLLYFAFSFNPSVVRSILKF